MFRLRVTGTITGARSTEFTLSVQTSGDNAQPGIIANNYIRASGSYALYFYYNTIKTCLSTNSTKQYWDTEGYITTERHPRTT